MKPSVLILILLGYTFFSVTESRHHHHHKHHRPYGRTALHYQERELKRSKRHLEDGEEKRSKLIVSPIMHSIRNKRAPRPYVSGQVQDVQIQIKLKSYWDASMWNMYTPQYRLLAGNLVDEVSNELVDNRNFIEARVLKLRPGGWNVLVDLSIKFFKTAINPVQYLEGIVGSGWISGQEVFDNYFKVLKIINGNEAFPAWNYPKGVKLRLHPAVLTKVPIKKVKQKVVLPANYKELRIAFHLHQKWNPFFQARFSSPFRLLSGNIEESIDRAFHGSSKYLDAETLGFRESPQGLVVVDMLVRFTSEEVYPAQKLKILVATGSVGGTPVISDSLSIYEINNIHSDKPVQEPNIEEFTKPHSDADVNQGLNETEIQKDKPSAILKETSEPIYPLLPKQSPPINVTTPAPETIPVTLKDDSASTNTSGGAVLSIRLERLRMLKQASLQQTTSQVSTSYENPKNNVLKETSESIYPKQLPIESETVSSQQTPVQQQQQNIIHQQVLPQGQPEQQQQPKEQPQMQQQQFPQLLRKQPATYQQIPSMTQQPSEQQQVEAQEKLLMNPPLQYVQQQQPSAEQQSQQQLPQQQQQVQARPESQQPKPVQPQQAQPAQYQQGQPSQPQQGQPSQPQNIQPAPSQPTHPQQTQSQPPQNLSQFSSNTVSPSTTPLNVSTTSAEALTHLVAGRLVLSSQETVNQGTTTGQEGQQKQLAQNSLLPVESQKTDEELAQLQQDLNKQNRNTNSSEIYNAASAESLPDSSDTPTLTKTLYPQITIMRNNTAENQSNTASSLIPEQINRPDTNAASNASYAGSRAENEAKVLNAAESFLSGNQDRDGKISEINEAEQEDKERNEDHSTIANILAGVVTEHRQNFKAVQFQISNSNANNSQANETIPVNPETVENATKHENETSQFSPEPNAYPEQTKVLQPFSPLYGLQANAHTEKPGQASTYPAVPSTANQSSLLSSPATFTYSPLKSVDSSFIKPTLGNNVPIGDSSQQEKYQQAESSSGTQVKYVPANASPSPEVQYEPKTTSITPQVKYEEAKTYLSMQDKFEQANTSINSENATQTAPVARPVEIEDKNAGSKPRRPPHVYTPSVEVYQWPPAVPVTNTAPPAQVEPFGENQKITSTQTVASSVYTRHVVHGKFILQQSWHPLLANNESVPYKVLTGIVSRSIEETFITHHMKVNCKVIGVSKAVHNTTTSNGMEKVGVQFDLNFLSNEVSVSKTMKEAVAVGQVSGLLVYPDSLTVQDEESPATSQPQQQPANQTTSSSSVVATSPMPIENTLEFKPANATLPTANNTQPNVETTSSKAAPTQPAAVEPVFQFVTAPKDLPKSCEEIRDLDIGHTDGQYVLEARKGCHLSVICQNMEDQHPKEFLGGPNKGQWAAYPFAVLIKISAQDKENVAQGACLESSEDGKKLLKQIYEAKGKQSTPTVPWKTNIKQMLTTKRRREVRRQATTTVILKSRRGTEDEERHPRSLNSHDGEWGVL